MYVCMFVCKFVCMFVCLAQKLPLLWLLIITIKHNDYIFSSSRYAYCLSLSASEGDSDRVSASV